MNPASNHWKQIKMVEPYMQPTELYNTGQEGSVIQDLVRLSGLNPYETF